LRETIYSIALGENAYKKMFSITHSLRDNGISTYIDFQPRSLKAQLRQANKLDCSFVLILGETELSSNTIILKDMQKGIQESIALDSTVTAVKQRIKSL